MHIKHMLFSLSNNLQVRRLFLLLLLPFQFCIYSWQNVKTFIKQIWFDISLLPSFSTFYITVFDENFAYSSDFVSQLEICNVQEKQRYHSTYFQILYSHLTQLRDDPLNSKANTVPDRVKEKSVLVISTPPSNLMRWIWLFDYTLFIGNIYLDENFMKRKALLQSIGLDFWKQNQLFIFSSFISS